MGKLVSGVAASALGLVIMAGSAHAILFDFSTLATGASSSFSMTVGGITVTLTGYNGLNTTVNLSTPQNVVRNSGNGLGVATYNSIQLNSCSNNCDNNPGEGILLDFGQIVTITQAQFSAFAGNDDVDYAIGNPPSNGDALNDITPVAGTWTAPSLNSRYIFFAAIQEDDDGTDSFWVKSITIDPISQVPEPGTIALFGAGLAFLGLAGRRRKS